MSVLNLRDVDDEVAARFRQAAGARGLTLPDYLTALVQLHESLRHEAETHPNETVREELMGWLVTLNLQPIKR